MYEIVKVHIIEDDNELQKAATFLLKNKKFDVSVSMNGDKAAEEVLANQPDLVLLDIMLTGKSGYEVAEELRKKGYDKPIVAMSNLDLESIDKKRLHATGTYSIFLKVTTNFDDIIAEIMNLTEGKSQAVANNKD